MNQVEFDRLPGLIERKEFADGSGLGKEDIDSMRAAWLKSKDPRKKDLGPENLQRLIEGGMLPVWVAPVRPGKKRNGKDGKDKRDGKDAKPKRYVKYYKVVLALIARFRM